MPPADLIFYLNSTADGIECNWFSAVFSGAKCESTVAAPGRWWDDSPKLVPPETAENPAYQEAANQATGS
jgi:hypothetical protein